MALVQHMSDVMEHPERLGLLCYPPADREGSREGVMHEIKRWMANNAKLRFKESD